MARCVPAFLSKVAEAIGMCRLVGGRIQLDVPAVVLAALGEHSPCRLELGALPRPTVCSALAHPELRLRVSSPAQVKACVRWSSLRFGFEGDGRVCGRRRRQPPASVESASRSFRSRDLFGFSVLSRGLFAFCMGQLFSVSLYGVSVLVLYVFLNNTGMLS